MRSLIVRDNKREYPLISHGSSIYLYDEEGNEYIDATSGSAAVSNLGHDNPAVIEAIYEASKRMAYCPSHHFVNSYALELADNLAAITPGDLNAVWFVSSGSEATENAVKIARQYQVERGNAGKHIIISRWQSYHGSTLGALGYGGITNRRKIYAPYLMNAPLISPTYCYRCSIDQSYPGCGMACAIELEKTIQRLGPENVAAFIAEPVVGAALGAVPPAKEYFPLVRDICSRYDVLLIVDEVMTGFGRTGKMFAIEHWDVEPDIMVLAKGISAGYVPLSAVIVHEEFTELLRKNNSNLICGHTFSAHHITAAAGLATLKYLQENNIVEQGAEKGAYFLDRLRSLVRHPIVGDVRGMGLFAGIEFVQDKQTKEPFPPHLRLSWKFGDKALENGLITYPGSGGLNGVAGDHILLAPPLIINNDEIDRIISILDKVLIEMQNDLL